jgi:hypothetical protein
LEKGGQGGFEAFLNPPKSPFAKGGLATTSLRLALVPLKGFLLNFYKISFFSGDIPVHE